MWSMSQSRNYIGIMNSVWLDTCQCITITANHNLCIQMWNTYKNTMEIIKTIGNIVLLRKEKLPYNGHRWLIFTKVLLFRNIDYSANTTWANGWGQDRVCAKFTFSLCSACDLLVSKNDELANFRMKTPENMCEKETNQVLKKKPLQMNINEYIHKRNVLLWEMNRTKLCVSVWIRLVEFVGWWMNLSVLVDTLQCLFYTSTLWKQCARYVSMLWVCFEMHTYSIVNVVCDIRRQSKTVEKKK